MIFRDHKSRKQEQNLFRVFKNHRLWTVRRGRRIVQDDRRVFSMPARVAGARPGASACTSTRGEIRKEGLSRLKRRHPVRPQRTTPHQRTRISFRRKGHDRRIATVRGGTSLCDSVNDQQRTDNLHKNTKLSASIEKPKTKQMLDRDLLGSDSTFEKTLLGRAR